MKIRIKALDYEPQFAENEKILVADEDFHTGIKSLEIEYENLTSLEHDVLLLASSVFAADLFVRRGEREEVVRSIALTVPVVNYHAFERQRALLEEILHFLSHDNWDIEFIQCGGSPEQAVDRQNNNGATLLFSGGLDSFAGAVDLIEERGPNKVLLASHVTRNPTTISAQKKLHAYLNDYYEHEVLRTVVRTGGKNNEGEIFADGQQEITQRTRSFMFLTIAAISARRNGFNDVIAIAENGQLAIHLPLSSARIGAFSTHTAHPQFVSQASRFFSELLQWRIEISNPYLYKTKAEVVARLCREHSDAIPHSVSCWKGSRVASGHCGVCIPCLVRRIALEHNGIATSGWERDILQENVLLLDETYDGKRNLIELASFIQDFLTMEGFELNINYCELRSTYFERGEATEMYRRFAKEAEAVLRSYPAGEVLE